MNEVINAALTRWIEKRAFPGAAYCYGTADKIVLGWAGTRTYGREWVDSSTWWDMASVTKVMSTTMAVYELVRKGEVRLDTPVRDVLPESKLGDGTIRNLLLHDCGLKPYDAMARKVTDASEARTRILGSSPVAKPGEKTAYSCLGFVNLMAIVERISGKNLAEFVQSEFYLKFGIEALYRPGPHMVGQIAPTEATPGWRRELARGRGEEWSVGDFICGTVHDPIAYILGGVSGNAGLFAPIGGVARFGQVLVSGQDVLGSEFGDWIDVGSSASSRAFGFDTKSPSGSSAGVKFGPKSFGHTGYTGTCIWVDPDAKVFAALLTNRVHPVDGDMQISQARPEFFDLAWEAATSAAFA
jgi:CubicO group peptidase (beta-lactamase class C family)